MTAASVKEAARPMQVLWHFVKRESPFLPGDGLLVKARRLVGRAIARIEGNGEFGHGVVFNTSSQVVGVDEHGCRMLDPWAESYEGLVLRLLEPLRPYELRAGQKWLHRQIGKPYPFIQIPVLYLLYKLDAAFPGTRRNAMLFSKARVCVAFLSEFWKQCGRDVVPGVHESVEAFTDLLESAQLGPYSKFPPAPDFDPTLTWPPIRIEGPVLLRRRR
jgi:hypothetical protein